MGAGAAQCVVWCGGGVCAGHGPRDGSRRRVLPVGELGEFSVRVGPGYLIATALTSLNVVWPRRAFWIPSCMRVVMPSWMAASTISSVLAFV